MSGFLHKQWIKQKLLNYLNDIDEPVKKPIRAQIFEVCSFRLETDNLKEKTCAKIHDKRFYIRCFFSEEYASIKPLGYDCFLNIERFKYSTNISHGLEDIRLMDVREDNDVKVALRRRYIKLYPFSHPGWGWRRVPHEQRKIDALPGWGSNTETLGPEPDINKQKLSAIVREKSKHFMKTTPAE
ncbi:3648_t:CDS:2, partial [Racocetra persica]